MALCTYRAEVGLIRLLIIHLNRTRKGIVIIGTYSGNDEHYNIERRMAGDVLIGQLTLGTQRTYARFQERLQRTANNKLRIEILVMLAPYPCSQCCCVT